jgi:hypothetical protein
MNFKNFWHHLRLYDRLTFGYLVLTALLIAGAPKSIPISIRARILASHIVVSGVIAALIYWGQLRPQRHPRYAPPSWVKFLRDWHPLLWFTFLLFGEFTYLTTLLFPNWIESYLIQFDFWLFGQPPHIFIWKNVPAWMVELMAFAYWSYYPIILGITMYYYFSRPHGVARRTYAFADFMNRLCFAFYICYLLFMIVPARSPRHALNLSGQLDLAGGPFYSLITAMQNYVSVVGAAFPSSHVAVAWIAVLALRDERRLAFWSLMPLVMALTLSIFILQYHYILDAIAGVILAFGFEWFWRKFYFRNKMLTTTNLQSTRMSAAASNLLT